MRRHTQQMRNQFRICWLDQPMSAAEERVVVGLTKAEKQLLEETARREGVSVGLLAYRRIFNKPDATRRAGRPPKNAAPTSEEGALFGMTG